MNAGDVRTLYAYNRWANDRIASACGAIDRATFDASSRGSFGSIRDTLAHIIWAEWVWLERWQHRSPAHADAPPMPDLPSIERVRRDVARGQQAFIDGLTDGRLVERIAYTNFKGERFEYTLGHMLQHVVNHSTYHRGQVVTLLRQANAAAISTDFLLWFDEGMPDASR